MRPIAEISSEKYFAHFFEVSPGTHVQGLEVQGSVSGTIILGLGSRSYCESLRGLWCQRGPVSSPQYLLEIVSNLDPFPVLWFACLEL